MTLFVDCNNSKYNLVSTGESKPIANIFKNDRDAYNEKFSHSANLHAVVFKNLSNDTGNGLMIFIQSSKDPSKTIAHIRCTAQLPNSPCLLLKLNVPLNISLLESTKSKAKRILESIGLKIDSNSKEIAIKSISCGKMRKLLGKMDSELSLNKFKFGVAYLDRFDTSEQQMLANTIEDPATSREFTAFLNGLGQEINLKGWKKFSGGLDVSEESLTGYRAIYKKLFDDSELIFHVSPWLPQSLIDDDNNLERKRYFGNDTIVIIYSESLYAFEMQTLLSRQIQVVLFVRFLNRLQKFEIHVYSKLPGLSIENNPIYMDNKAEDFDKLALLLVTLERQCYNCEPLNEKLHYMRNFHLNQIVNKFI